MNIHHEIIAIDIRDSNVANLENWFLITNYITSDATRMYLRHCMTNWKEYDNPYQMVYIINDHFFAHSHENTFPEIDFQDGMSEELLKFIIPIQLSEIELYRSVLIDWIFNMQRKMPKTAKAFRALQKYEEDEFIFHRNFVTSVTSISVEGLGFVLKDILAPMDDRFKAILQEFKNNYISDKYLTKIKLTRIFIIDAYILGYSFRMENEPKEHFFWNYYFEEHLQMIQPFTFDQEISVTLNDVLDKIIKVGIENLSDRDRDILNK
ncbi:hypothetical protein [Flavobacterium tegetincola]|uniref:hypothetical protein n=1 Tax=Flavobacterium tegetincola TaxID=150172 RepID=UPI00047DEF72|nr:hypothetical protein [Flavobacterium tegetincola]